MSDDEYYVDSPYDEFEEMLWDADPAPHLADDLAQHAAYSPVWQDDPVGELEQYHSDWEYYSDDYYDDDPAILRVHPADGTLPQARGFLRPSRVKKRKLAERADAYESKENKVLRSTIQGTVWAKHVTAQVETFKSGKYEKVALLTDWRKRFALETNKTDAGNSRNLSKDEAWANDLSLSDMGLKRPHQEETKTTETVHSERDTDQEEMDEEPSLYTDSNESPFEEQVLSENAVAVPQLLESPAKTMSQQKKRHAEELNLLQHPSRQDSREVVADNQQQEPQPNSLKRRKIANPHTSILSATVFPTPDSEAALDATTRLRANEKSLTSNNSTRLPKQQYNPDQTANKPSEPSQKLKEKSRKRRLSSSTDETSNTVASTASSRAKRVASTKLQNKKSLATEDNRPALGTRAARARQK